MLTLRNISLTLGKKTKLEKKVLKHLNLHVKEGEFVVIIGPNGAGKSTLFKVILGILKPDSGEILIDQKDVTPVSQKTRAALVASVLQDPRIGTMENMTILENMAFALQRGKKRFFVPFSNLQRKEKFQEMLSLLKMGLENRLHEPVSHLSGGQRQALSMIMAILSDSKILLLDEITAALDPKTAENVMQITNTIITREQKTSILITHNMSYAIEYGDRTLLLKEGTLVKEFSQATKKKLTPLDLAAEFNEI